MPRFVVLRHECPPGFGKPSHWDLMLEDGAALLTWSLLELPTPGGAAVAAQRLPEHRLAYLEYEGPLSRGRGEVRRVAAGGLCWIERTPSCLAAQVDGEYWSARLALEHIEGEIWSCGLDAEAPMLWRPSSES